MCSHYQGIHEQSQHLFRIDPATVANRCPHRYVLLPRVPRQQHLKPRQQRHEQRRSFPPPQLPQSLHHLSLQPPSHPPSPITLHPTPLPLPVHPQLQIFPPLQLPPPVPQLLLQLSSFQPSPLPHRIIPVLHLQLP